jgi:hypothetical protein
MKRAGQSLDIGEQRHNRLALAWIVGVTNLVYGGGVTTAGAGATSTGAGSTTVGGCTGVTVRSEHEKQPVAVRHAKTAIATTNERPLSGFI